MTPYFPAPLDGAQWPPPPLPQGWVAEVKLDGWRAWCSPDGVVTSRSGQVLGRGPATGVWLDGEWYAGRFYAWGIPQLRAGHGDVRRILTDWSSVRTGRFELDLVPEAPSWFYGSDALDPAGVTGWEGVVYKKLDAPYPERDGVTASWVKYRRVLGTGQGGRS